MILESCSIEDKLRIEIVDGDDIVATYRNSTKVSSCMSHYGAWRYTKFFTFVKGLKMFRIMKDDTLMGRSLIWDVHNENQRLKFFDEMYYSFYGYENRPSAKDGQISMPGIRNLMINHWPKFADVRSTAQQWFATVEPNRMRKIPYIDTFQYSLERRPKTLTNTKPHKSYYQFVSLVGNSYYINGGMW